MAVQLHYYGSVFNLDTSREDDAWRATVSDYLDRLESGGRLVAWFDLEGGGHVSLRLSTDTPLAIVST